MTLQRFALAVLLACRSSSPPTAIPSASASSVAAIPDTPATAAAPAPSPVPDPGRAVHGHKYALVVDFFSPGNGTDREAAKRLDELIGRTTPMPVRVRGRYRNSKEGEYDDCFDLKELDSKGKAAFMDAVQRDVIDAAPNPRERIEKSAPCGDE